MTGVAAAERKAFRVLVRLLLRIVIVMLAGRDLNLEPVESDVGDVSAPQTQQIGINREFVRRDQGRNVATTLVVNREAGPHGV